MRGHDTTKDTPTGAVVRRNVMGLLEAKGKVPRDLYGALSLTAARFWEQFIQRKNGPRLDLVERMATELGVPLWRLLIREGEAPPKEASFDSPDLQTVRHFVRGAAVDFAPSCEIPTEPRNRETPLNFRIRQNIAIGCWQKWLVEADLYAALSVPRATYHAWFRKKTGLAMVDLWRIAEVLEMQPWELVAEVRMEGKPGADHER